jgi:hypothetical protein
MVAPASVVASVAQASVAPSATPLAEVVLASLVRLLVDSAVPSVLPQMVASVETLAATANSPLVDKAANSVAMTMVNSPLVAKAANSVAMTLVNSPSVAKAANSVAMTMVNSPSVVPVVLPSILAAANSTLVVPVENSLLAAANSPLVAEVVPSVPPLALKLSAPRAVELNSDFLVVALMSPEASRVNSTTSAVNPLEDVKLLRLELTPLRAVPLELDKLLLKVKRVAKVLMVLMALPTIPLRPLPEDLVLPKLEPNPNKLLLSVQEDLLPKDNVVASRLVSQA